MTWAMRLPTMLSCTRMLPAGVIGLLTLYLSFSRAGWFCRLGLRADSRPVSVLMLRLQWMRSRLPWLSTVAISLPCRGLMKLLSRVSMAPSSHKASTAATRGPSVQL